MCCQTYLRLVLAVAAVVGSGASITKFVPPFARTEGCTARQPWASKEFYNNSMFPNCDKEYYAKQYYKAYTSGMLRSDHRVSVTLHILAEDNFSNPNVPDSRVQNQVAYLQQVFKPYGITFDVNKRLVNSSFYRARLNLPFCDKKKVGDGQCDIQFCNESLTQFDGGDCLSHLPHCPNAAVGNGVCNENCNFAKYHYDGGDCCQGSNDPAQTCADPSSPLLRWYSYNDFKQLAFVRPGLTTFNIGVSSMPQCPWCGGMTTQAYFPGLEAWKTNMGGSVLRDITIGGVHDVGVKGHGGIMLHELGHALGLGHVFQGVAAGQFNMNGGPFCNHEGPFNNRACLEPQPPPGKESSWVLGDLCPDTRPAPVAKGCSGAAIEHSALVPPTDCLGKDWVDFPTNNFMGFNYLGDNCGLSFTKCQQARMRCYLDDTYSSWYVDAAVSRPSTIVLEPVAMLLPNASAPQKVHLEFAAPLDIGRRDGNRDGNAMLRFHIERMSVETGDVKFYQLEQTVVAGEMVEFIDNALPAGNSYVYQVKAENIQASQTAYKLSFPSNRIFIPPPTNPKRHSKKKPTDDTLVIIALVLFLGIAVCISLYWYRRQKLLGQPVCKIWKDSCRESCWCSRWFGDRKGNYNNYAISEADTDRGYEAIF